MSPVATSHPSDRISRAKRFVLGLLFLALILLAGWYVGYLRQPRYNGVTLNGWLREFPHAWDTSFFADLRGIPTRADFGVYHQELKALGASIEIVMPCLIRALDANDALVRGQAAHLLSTYGRGALPALPRLRQIIEQTDDDDERARLVEVATKIESPGKVVGAYVTNFPSRRTR